MTGKDVYLQMTWSWPDKTWNILCSYCLQWNTSQSKFRNHYFLFYLRFPYCPNFFWFGVVCFWGWVCKVSKTLWNVKNKQKLFSRSRTSLKIKFSHAFLGSLGRLCKVFGELLYIHWQNNAWVWQSYLTSLSNSSITLVIHSQTWVVQNNTPWSRKIMTHVKGVCWRCISNPGVSEE